jgi:hypothetical protein
MADKQDHPDITAPWNGLNVIVPRCFFIAGLAVLAVLGATGAFAQFGIFMCLLVAAGAALEYFIFVSIAKKRNAYVLGLPYRALVVGKYTSARCATCILVLEYVINGEKIRAGGRVSEKTYCSTHAGEEVSISVCPGRPYTWVFQKR